jgi:hypothetical protein
VHRSQKKHLAEIADSADELPPYEQAAQNPVPAYAVKDPFKPNIVKRFWRSIKRNLKKIVKFSTQNGRFDPIFRLLLPSNRILVKRWDQPHYRWNYDFAPGKLATPLYLNFAHTKRRNFRISLPDHESKPSSTSIAILRYKKGPQY